MNLKIQGDAQCFAQPAKRRAVLEGNILTFPNPRLGPCSGSVNADGSFGFMCGHVGNVPSVSFAGKISGDQITGTQGFELLASAGVGTHISCRMPFEGTKTRAAN